MTETNTRPITLAIMNAGAACLRYLREHGGTATKATLAAHCDVSPVTIQRALDWLRDDHDAPLDFHRSTNVWTLGDLDFTLPLFDPSIEDLAAVLFAAELLAPIAGHELNGRLERILESIDAKLTRDGEHARVRSHAVSATMTSGQRVDAGVVAQLLTAARRQVVRIRYFSPWTNSVHTYELEPWQIRIHDGTWYLRAWSRTSSGARTYRVAQIQDCFVLPGYEPREPVPAAAELWGDDAFGVDEDRPDTAIVEVHGPVARWVALDTWHPSQTDEWLVEGEHLRRTLKYRSCRELARRLLTLGDALGRVEPAALRDEVAAHAKALVRAQTSDSSG